MTQKSTLFHASCVSIEDRAVLLTGPSGIGKSDVALRLIDAGAILVADDQTALWGEAGALWAAPPETLEGLIEVRHLGLYKLPYLKLARVHLWVDLVEGGLDRLPEQTEDSLLDCTLQKLRLVGIEASTPAKIRLALQRMRWDD